MKRLIPYMKGYWKECILGPVFKLLEAIFELPKALTLVLPIGMWATSGRWAA